MKPAKNLSVELPECELVKITLGRGSSLEKVWLSNEQGLKHTLESSRKKGSDNKTPLEIPKGKWTLNFTLSKIASSPVKIEASQKVLFPKELIKHIKKVKITLPKLGSFGKNFDPAGEKTRNYAKMLAHRIAVQQEKGWLLESPKLCLTKFLYISLWPGFTFHRRYTVQ